MAINKIVSKIIVKIIEIIRSKTFHKATKDKAGEQESTKGGKKAAAKKEDKQEQKPAKEDKKVPAGKDKKSSKKKQKTERAENWEAYIKDYIQIISFILLIFSFSLVYGAIKQYITSRLISFLVIATSFIVLTALVRIIDILRGGYRRLKIGKWTRGELRRRCRREIDLLPDEEGKTKPSLRRLTDKELREVYLRLSEAGRNASGKGKKRNGILRISIAQDVYDAYSETKYLLKRAFKADIILAFIFFLPLFILYFPLRVLLLFAGRYMFDYANFLRRIERDKSVLSSIVDNNRKEDNNQKQVVIEAVIQDVISARNYGFVRRAGRRLKVSWIRTKLESPNFAGILRFILSRYMLAVISWYVSGPIAEGIVTGLPLLSGNFLPLEIFYNLIIGFVGFFSKPGGDFVRGFLFTYIAPSYLNLIRIFILNLALSVRLGTKNIIHSRKDIYYAPEFKLASLNLEKTLALIAAGKLNVNDENLKRAYRSSLMYTTFCPEAASLARKKFEQKPSFLAKIKTHSLLIPLSLAIYVVNTVLIGYTRIWRAIYKDEVEKLRKANPKGLTSRQTKLLQKSMWIETLGSLRVSFWTGYLGLCTISAEIAAARGLGSVLGGPVEAVIDSWEGDHGLIGVGSEIVKATEQGISQAASTFYGGEVDIDIAEGIYHLFGGEGPRRAVEAFVAYRNKELNFASSQAIGLQPDSQRDADEMKEEAETLRGLMDRSPGLSMKGFLGLIGAEGYARPDSLEQASQEETEEKQAESQPEDRVLDEPQDEQEETQQARQEESQKPKRPHLSFWDEITRGIKEKEDITQPVRDWFARLIGDRLAQNGEDGVALDVRTAESDDILKTIEGKQQIVMVRIGSDDKSSFYYATPEGEVKKDTIEDIDYPEIPSETLLFVSRSFLEELSKADEAKQGEAETRFLGVVDALLDDVPEQRLVLSDIDDAALKQSLGDNDEEEADTRDVPEGTGKDILSIPERLRAMLVRRDDEPVKSLKDLWTSPDDKDTVAEALEMLGFKQDFLYSRLARDKIIAAFLEFRQESKDDLDGVSLRRLNQEDYFSKFINALAGAVEAEQDSQDEINGKREQIKTVKNPEKIKEIQRDILIAKRQDEQRSQRIDEISSEKLNGRPGIFDGLFSWLGDAFKDDPREEIRRQQQALEEKLLTRQIADIEDNQLLRDVYSILSHSDNILSLRQQSLASQNIQDKILRAIAQEKTDLALEIQSLKMSQIDVTGIKQQIDETTGDLRPDSELGKILTAWEDIEEDTAVADTLRDLIALAVKAHGDSLSLRGKLDSDALIEEETPLEEYRMILSAMRQQYLEKLKEADKDFWGRKVFDDDFWGRSLEGFKTGFEELKDFYSNYIRSKILINQIEQMLPEGLEPSEGIIWKQLDNFDEEARESLRARLDDSPYWDTFILGIKRAASTQAKEEELEKTARRLIAIDADSENANLLEAFLGMVIEKLKILEAAEEKEQRERSQEEKLLSDLGDLLFALQYVYSAQYKKLGQNPVDGDIIDKVEKIFRGAASYKELLDRLSNPEVKAVYDGLRGLLDLDEAESLEPQEVVVPDRIDELTERVADNIKAELEQLQREIQAHRGTPTQAPENRQHTPDTNQVVDVNTPQDANHLADPNRVTDPNQVNDANTPTETTQVTDVNDPAAANNPQDANQPQDANTPAGAQDANQQQDSQEESKTLYELLQELKDKREKVQKQVSLIANVHWLRLGFHEFFGATSEREKRMQRLTDEFDSVYEKVQAKKALLDELSQREQSYAQALSYAEARALSEVQAQLDNPSVELDDIDNLMTVIGEILGDNPGQAQLKALQEIVEYRATTLRKLVDNYEGWEEFLTQIIFNQDNYLPDREVELQSTYHDLSSLLRLHELYIQDASITEALEKYLGFEDKPPFEALIKALSYRLAKADNGLEGFLCELKLHFAGVAAEDTHQVKGTQELNMIYSDGEPSGLYYSGDVESGIRAYDEDKNPIVLLDGESIVHGDITLRRQANRIWAHWKGEDREYSLGEMGRDRENT
ncbi:MAG: hypothetical protein JRI96_14400, partial [Deltaproteobacteria bacterium]|nr:hypothetical protein [Deltaproteobacteria bacterium]